MDKPIYSTCIVPTCGKPLGSESKDLDYRVCHEHRLCPVCNLEMRPQEIQLAHDRAIEDNSSIDLGHPRCLIHPFAKSVENDPTITVKQSYYDFLNMVRLMVQPDMALAVSTNENNAMIQNTRFVASMDWDQKYAHLKMLEACVAQVSIALAQDRKKLKERADIREEGKKAKAEKEAKTSTRPIGKSAESLDEQSLSMFMENFGFKSRKTALKQQRLRDKSVVAFQALSMSSAMAKDAADRILRENIAKGLVELEDK